MISLCSRFIILMVYATILIFCNSLYTSNSYANELIIEKKQGFLSKFEDINSNDVTLNDFNGKLLLINLWATWCEPCKEEMPSLDRLQQKYDKQDFQILAISVDRGPKKKSVNFFNEYEIQNIDLFFDDKNNIPREVRAAGLPFSFFIDQEGNQIAKFIGPTEWDSDYFEDYIDSNL